MLSGKLLGALKGALRKTSWNTSLITSTSTLQNFWNTTSRKEQLEKCYKELFREHCMDNYIYILNFAFISPKIWPIYHLNQDYISVIWIWEEYENPDPPFISFWLSVLTSPPPFRLFYIFGTFCILNAFLSQYMYFYFSMTSYSWYYQQTSGLILPHFFLQ